MNAQPRSPVERGVLWLVVALVTALFLWMLRGFAMAIFGAVVLSILFYPVFESFLKKMPKYPAAASLITVIMALLFVGVPLYLLLYLLAQQAFDLYQLITHDPAGLLNSLSGKLPPEIRQQVSTWFLETRTQLADALRAVASSAFSTAAAATSSTLVFVIKLIVALYLMFFFLKDGEKILRTMSDHFPLPDSQERTLFARFVSTVRAVVKGGIIVALVQGFIGGSLFWLVGIPQAMLWGAVMFFLALIPLGGPLLVWLPASLLLFYTGYPTQALVLVLGGTFIIGTIDNFLRPVLVGRDTEMPNALVFISILAGITSFGVAGIVVGPVIAALFLSVWQLLDEGVRGE